MSMELTVKRFGELTRDELYEILRVRVAVFVVEQRCPYQEPDGMDQVAWHVFLHEDGAIRAYLRVFPAGAETAAIGRVLTTRRGDGLGTRILREGLAVARDRMGVRRVTLEAQVYAMGFYERAGFRAVGEQFLEDDIPHIRMELEL